jgi:DNA mismatch repair ATPase MutS
VAKLAGLNDTVLERASQIMGLLKERDSDLTETFYNEKIFQQKGSNVNSVNNMVNNDNKAPNMLADKPPENYSAMQGKIEKLLRETEPEKMTPLEALNLLCQWKKLLNTGNGETEKQQEKKQRNKLADKENDGFPSLFDSY